MTPSATTPKHVHNSACETAAQANCRCFCHGAGHQNDLVVRAASCSNTADEAVLARNVETLLGGFHSSFRDVTTTTRAARKLPTSAEAASFTHDTGRGATWLETLLVDEALHVMFLHTAAQSTRESRAQREERRLFVERITNGAIGVVGSTVTFTSVAESHVWCSIVAEHVSTFTPLTPGESLPAVFDDICYPRQTAGRRPRSLPAVRAAGLAHLSTAERAAPSLTASARLSLMRLVAAATCPDIWHHPAVARFCVTPFVTGPSWPPAHTTKIVTPIQIKQLERRWSRKGHW